MDGDRPKVMRLYLEDYEWLDEMYEKFLATLKARTQLIDCRKAEEAIQHLERRDLHAVLVYEPSIMKNDTKAKAVVSSLLSFIKTGGTLVFACLCSSFVSPPDVDAFFSAWGLPWKVSSYTRSHYQFNVNARVDVKPKITGDYCVKALSLGDVGNEDLIYVEEYEEDENEDEESASRSKGPRTEGPAVMAPYHKGRLGWVGDVNNEEPMWDLVLSMLGV